MKSVSYGDSPYQELRNEIYSMAKDEFGTERYLNQILTVSNMGTLLTFYDSVVFNGELGDMINKSNAIVTFNVIMNPSGDSEEDEAYCKILEVEGERGATESRISIEIPASKINELQSSGITKCRTTLGCVMFTLEFLITSLILTLAFVIDLIVFEDIDEAIRMLECMTEKLFGNTPDEIQLLLPKKRTPPKVPSPRVPSPKRTPPKVPSSQAIRRPVSNLPHSLVGFKNYSNSCYIDSILMIMFLSDTDFWVKNMLDVDVEELESKYTGNECLGSDVTMNKLSDLVKQIQNQLNQDRNRIINDMKQRTSSPKPSDTNLLTCSIIRNLLVKCRLDMKVRDNWIVYNDASTYDLFTDIFPSTKLQIPQKTKEGNIDGPVVWVDFIEQGAIPMIDYLQGSTISQRQGDYIYEKGIDWDNIDTPILAFLSGGAPKVKKLGEAGIETVVMKIDYERPMSPDNRLEFQFEKIRKFGPTILNGRYKLIGATMLHGVDEFGGGGVHYTSYFLFQNNWYNYNDITGIAKRIGDFDSLPDTVWTEQNRIMPSMYFYKLV